MNNKNVVMGRLSRGSIAILVVFSIIELIAFFEFNVFHMYKYVFIANAGDPASELIYSLFRFITTMALLLPFIVFIGYPFIVFANRASWKNAVFIEINRNNIKGVLYFSSGPVVDVDSSFSSESELFANIELLEQELNGIIKKLFANKSIFTPSPYLLFTSKSPLTKAEIEFVKPAIINAGVIDAFYMKSENAIQPNKVRQFIRAQSFS